MEMSPPVIWQAIFWMNFSDLGSESFFLLSFQASVSIRLPYQPPTKVKQQTKNNLYPKGLSLTLGQELWATNWPGLSKVFLYFWYGSLEKTCWLLPLLFLSSSRTRLPTDYLALEPNTKVTLSQLSSHIWQRSFLEQVKPGSLAPTFTAAYLWDGLQGLRRSKCVLWEGDLFSWFL